MGVQTRSSASNSPIKSRPSVKPVLSIGEGERPKLFVLPKDSSPDARFLLLRHPQETTARRYLCCPRKGLYEFTKVHTPGLEPRSILLTPATCARSNERAKGSDTSPDPTDTRSIDISATTDGVTESSIASGYVKKDAELFIATPVDMIFMTLAAIVPPQSTIKSSENQLFKSIDDLMERHLDEVPHFRHVLETNGANIERAMEDICDMVDAGDDRMYRLNEKKVLRLLLAKAKAVVERGLPQSLEERFIRRALEVPVLSVKRDERTLKGALVSDEDKENQVDAIESQPSTNGSFASTVISEVSSVTTIECTVKDDTPVSIVYLQRLRRALTFIITSYLSPQLCKRLLKLLSLNHGMVDFTALDAHLKSLTDLRNEALASRSVTDFSRKRSNVDDDEAAEGRTEKKRKQEEEEKRKKASESRGVRDLKKVDVSGMKKMSDFFTKKPLTAKTKS